MIAGWSEISRLHIPRGVALREMPRLNAPTRYNSRPACQPLKVIPMSGEGKGRVGSWTREGWRYVAVVLDVYSRRVVGYAMKKRRQRDEEAPPAYWW